MKYLGKRERPMEEAMLRGDRPRGVEESLRDAQRKAASAPEQHIDQLAKGRAVRRAGIGPEPSRAPDIERAAVAAKHSFGRLQRRQGLFLGADDRCRAALLLRKPGARLHRLPKHGREVRRFE